MSTFVDIVDPKRAVTPSPSASAKRESSFQAVEGNPGESRSGEVLLVQAYAALWVILLVWIAILWKKQGALHERADRLERALDRAHEGGKG